LSPGAQEQDVTKVSIGLRGWRFEESDVFTADGDLRPLAEMPASARERVSRLTTLVTAPCDCCWLIHGDENVDRCDVAAVVYGEPDGEVVLCDEHEDDFVYWYREEGGDEFRGDLELQDRFHEWFGAGNRSPDWFHGVDHVETEPEALPDPEAVDLSDVDPELPTERKERIDLRNMEVRRGADAERDEADPVPTDEADVDLTRDYPG
jgi:hypothetical protein